MFGLSSSLPPLVGGSGGLVCESVGKTDMLSDNFDGKQSRQSVDLALTCHPSPRRTTFAFRSREVRCLLLNSTVLLCCQLPTDFHNISIIKVFERLVAVRLGRFMERSGVLPTTQFAYRKGLGTCDVLLCQSHTLKCIGEWAGGLDRTD